MTLIDVDLDPTSENLLQSFCSKYHMNPSEFVNDLIKLHYDQTKPRTRQAHQQVQYQQPVQQYRQPAYDYDDSGYLGTIDGLEPVQTVRQSPKLHRDYKSVGTILNGGGVTNRQPKPKATLVRSQPKTVSRKTR